MNVSLTNNSSFVELEENVLSEVNGGLPVKAIVKIAKLALAGAGGGFGYGVCKKIFG